MSNFHVVGGNTKFAMQDDIAWYDTSDGDLVLCEPGADLCSSRLFNIREGYGYVSGSMFDEPYKIGDLPVWTLGNRRGYTYRSGIDAHVFDLTDFAYNDEYYVNHASDPDGKRYFEAWITYYPTSEHTAYVSPGITGDTLTTSDHIELFPNLYPDLVQSITLPTGPDAEAQMAAYYDHIGFQPESDANMIAVWGGKYALIYEWNDANTEYDQKFFFDYADCTAVRSVGISVDGTVAVIHYWDNFLVTNRLATLSYSGGVWTIDSHRDAPQTGYTHQIYVTGTTTKYIIIGGVAYTAAVYKLEDLSLYFEGSTVDDWDITGSYYNYAYDRTDPFAWGNAQSCFLGICHDAVIGKYLRTGYGNVYEIEYPFYDPRFAEYTIYGPIMAWHDEDSYGGTTVRTYAHALWPYPYHQDPDDVSFNMPSVNNAYIWGRYLVGFGGRVYYCHEDYPSETIELDVYNAATHKIYDGTFLPVKHPYYLTRHSDGTLKLLKIGKHYDESSPGTINLRFSSPTHITTLTDFVSNIQHTRTDVLYLFSWDQATWYKYTTSWVVESDPASGMTGTSFRTGAQAGLTAPAEHTLAWVKCYITTTDPDVSPILIPGSIKLSMTTISTATNAYLCDDSKLDVEHVSDTQTKITSKIGQNVILQCQLVVIAPPYDEQYEDNT